MLSETDICGWSGEGGWLLLKPNKKGRVCKKRFTSESNLFVEFFSPFRPQKRFTLSQFYPTNLYKVQRGRRKLNGAKDAVLFYHHLCCNFTTNLQLYSTTRNSWICLFTLITCFSTIQSMI